MANHWAIAVGINHYHNFQPLIYAQRDAQIFHQFLVQEAGFPPEQCLLLTDSLPEVERVRSYPNRDNLQNQIAHICQQVVQTGDLLWVFFSGYGVRAQGKDYLMPLEGDPDRVAETGIGIESFFDAFQAAPTDNIILVLDVNRSQSVLSGEGFGEETAALSQKFGIPTLLSCQPDQFSHETLALRQGLFTAALVEGLRYGYITLEQLDRYLMYRLPELSEHHWRPRQDPCLLVPPEKEYLLIVPREAAVILGSVRRVMLDTQQDYRAQDFAIQAEHALWSSRASSTLAIPERSLKDSAVASAPTSHRATATLPAQATLPAASLPVLDPSAPALPEALLNQEDFAPELPDLPESSEWVERDGIDPALPDWFDRERLVPELPELTDPEPFPSEPFPSEPFPSEPFNPEQLQAKQLQPKPLKPEQPQPEQFQPEQFQPERFQPEHLLPEQLQPQHLPPKSFNPAQLPSAPIPPTRIRPATLPTPFSLTEISDDLFWKRMITWAGIGTVLLFSGALLRNCAMLSSSQVAVNLPENSIGQSVITPPDLSQIQLVASSPLADSLTLLKNGEYETAHKQLEEIPAAQRNPAYVQLLEQTNRGLLYQARTVLVRVREGAQENQVSDFVDAMKLARLIRPTQPLYREAQRDIDRWSQIIFDMAQGKAGRKTAVDAPLDAAKNYMAAIATAQFVPTDRVVLYQQAQQAIASWSQVLYQIARARAEAEDLDAAVKIAEKIPQGVAIHPQAQQAIASWRKQSVSEEDLQTPIPAGTAPLIPPPVNEYIPPEPAPNPEYIAPEPVEPSDIAAPLAEEGAIEETPLPVEELPPAPPPENSDQQF